MVNRLENMEVVAAADVQAGDVLLRVLQPKTRFDYIVDLLFLLRELEENDGDIIAVLAEYGDLMEIAITLFDQSEYCRVAYCVENTTNEEPAGCQVKVWEERHGKGIIESGLESCNEHSSAVLRYKNEEGDLVGSAALSAEPLDKSARDIAGDIFSNLEGKLTPYPSTQVLMALCINRTAQGSLAKELEQRLTSYFGSKYEKEIADVCNAVGPTIAAWLDDTARKILRQYWDDKNVICSQFVATVFKSTEPEGAYPIAKNSKAKTDIQRNIKARSKDPVDKAAVEELTQRLLTLPMPPLCTELRSFEDIAKVAKFDDMYTPADFAHSPNMEIIGKLVF